MNDEIDRLLPLANDIAADWDDIVSRAGVLQPTRRRRGLVVLVAIAAVVVVSAGIALGATVLFRPGSDRSLKIASGRDWALVAHRSHGDLCIAYGAPGVASSGCRIRVPHTFSLFTVGPSSLAGSTSRRPARVIGFLSPSVGRVTVTSSDRSVAARIYPLPEFFASPVRVFVAELPLRSFSDLKVLAYDRTGRRLDPKD